MAQWDLFLVVTALVLVAVLVLARLSQRTLKEELLSGEDQPSTTETEVGHRPATEISDDKRRDIPDDKRREVSAPASGTPTADECTDPQAEESTALGEPEPPEFTTGMLLANVALTQGLVAVILLGAAWYFSIPGRALGVTGGAANTGLPAIAVGLVFGVALWIANETATAVADAVGAAYDEAVRTLLAPDSTPGWAVLFVAVLPTIAVGEELLFRAALVGVPNAGYGVSVWLLAAVASVAFALGHGAQGRVGVVVTGALGFVLAAGYVLTGSLVVVVVAHYVINALEFLVHELLELEDLTFGRAGDLVG